MKLDGGKLTSRGSAARASLWLFAAALALFCWPRGEGGRAEAEPHFGIAMHGEPKYGPDLAHLDYVEPSAPKGGTLRLGVQGSFDSLNPNIIRGVPAAGLRDYVFESLMGRSYDEPFSLYGLLAESIDTPEDRSSVTFELRPEARFSDGTPVTPEDVLFTWALLRDKGAVYQRTYYKKVSKAEKVGERGVLFTFASAGDREMPLIMGLMPILPKHLIDPAAFDRTSFEKPVGSGPYIVSEVTPGTSIAYRRNPNYWGRDLPLNRGQYNFDVIRYDYYRNDTSLMEAFRTGLIDEMSESDPIRWETAYSFPAAREGLVKKLEFGLSVPSGMLALVFNTRRPVFADRRVREALTIAFDFEWIDKTLFRGLYQRTESFFDRSELSSHGRPADAREQTLLAPYQAELLPGIMDGGFAEPVSDGTGLNREGRRRAIALLREAGYVLRDGVMVGAATGVPLSFEMLCETREQERLMLAYAEGLRQIGIAPRIRMVESAEYEERFKRFDYDMIEAFWPASLSPGNEQLGRWSSAAADNPGALNYAGVKSPAVDAMIGALLAAKTRPEFVSAVRALDRVLLSGRYVIPLYHTQRQWIAAWARLRHPPGTTLYGARLETWWMDSAKSAAVP